MINGETQFLSLESEWFAALYFEAKGPSAGLQYIAQEDKVQLSALKAQALNGPMNEAHLFSPAFEDSSHRQRREAWRALGDMPRDKAKRGYLDLLTKVLPNWRRWYATHGQGHASEAAAADGAAPKGGSAVAQAAGADSSSLADKLLKDFESRTGVKVQHLSKL